jgi:nicotinate (nicotinamide) nucleotide adenylyltransferase
MKDIEKKTDSPLLWELLGLNSKYDSRSADDAYRKISDFSKNAKEIKLAWKILRDPFFGSAYKYLKSSKKIFEAGFFIDKTNLDYDNSEREDPSWLVTPIYKTLNQLKTSEKRKSTKPLTVLLATGAFSPIHDGHIGMMEVAKSELQNKGYEVIGGYISPSHDGYVSIKNSGEAALNAAVRTQLCKIAVRESDWMMVDPWEALHTNIALNYTDVIIRLEKYLNFHIKNDRKIHVVCVFGSDNANFARAFITKGICVCVNRKGYENNFSKLKKESFMANNKRIFLAKRFSIKNDVSSSLIRKGKYSNIDENVKKTYLEYFKKDKKNIKKSDKMLYVIRDDSTWAIKSWKDKSYNFPVGELLKKFASLVDSVYQSKNSENPQMDLITCFLDAEEQSRSIKKISKQNSIISLDVYCKGKYNLEVSRKFSISADQFRPETLVVRPGRKDIEKEIKRIPAGSYTLIEDDIASGSTIKFIKKHLPMNVRIKKILVLADLVKKKFFDRRMDNMYS